MKPTRGKFAEQYEAALRKYLEQGLRATFTAALRLGHRAVALRLETLELAQIHERAVAVLAPTDGRKAWTARAEKFFVEATTPIVETHRAARQSNDDLKRMNKELGRQSLALGATNRRLQRGITRRKGVEDALNKSGNHYARQLKESLELQGRLRQLTHQVLSAQEDERKDISRELQHEIAQTLLGINVRLLTLKQEARSNAKGLKIEIASTQRLVAKSAQSVRRVARELRSP